MDNILNGKDAKSQPLEVVSSSQLKSTEDDLLSRLVAILIQRDNKDLLMLEYILKININYRQSIRVEHLMEYMNMSNASVSIRLKKMRETGQDMEFPLLETFKDGNAFCYYFSSSIDSTKALSLINRIMSIRKINYDSYAADKGILADINEELEDQKEYESEEQVLDEGESEEQVLDEDEIVDQLDEDEIVDQLDEDESEEQVLDEDEIVDQLDEEDNWTNENQALEEISFDELSTRTVTMGEVLEMIDEASNTLIETITEKLTEVFNEKITQLNNRIVELEEKIPSSQASIDNEESNEELLARARMLIRQKIFAKKVK